MAFEGMGIRFEKAGLVALKIQLKFKRESQQLKVE